MRMSLVCYTATLTVILHAGCEEPCKPGYAKAGWDCKRLPDSGADDDAAVSGSGRTKDGGQDGTSPVADGGATGVEPDELEGCPEGTWERYADDGGTVRAADDSGGGDSNCELMLCAADHHVVQHICVPCERGTVRKAGDNASGSDTMCMCPTGYGGL